MNSNKKVPDDPTAKLMYLIECLSSIFQLKDKKYQKYRDYSNYLRMSLADKKNLTKIARSVIPDHLWLYLDDKKKIDERLKIKNINTKEQNLNDFSYEWFVIYFFEPLENLKKEIKYQFVKESLNSTKINQSNVFIKPNYSNFKNLNEDVDSKKNNCKILVTRF
ncbi:unnamed protein product [Brachionus calyciflorus]|uniref:Uncharacterized protein n=1 Tax=Brachionus calyciflorus TaxID=104777 RepID=A0A814GER0_9BILA|nr:unnamed protein product [Brachionus calyciflorus]